MKVIVDLYTVLGLQNGNDHSGIRDGFQEWGDPHINETVSVIEFLAARYANRPSLLAIELMNEPLALGVSWTVLRKYYQLGYAAVRKYAPNAYVILSNRLGTDRNKKLFSLASGLSHLVIDVHYYNLYNDTLLKNITPQENIDYIYNDRAAQLREVTQSNGPLSFVGEWTAEWELENTLIEDYAEAQQEVYGKATFGWAFWSYKNDHLHWSFEQLIMNKSINLKG